MSASTFESDFSKYISRVKSAENESQRAYYFIEFLRQDLDVAEEFIGRPTDLRPNLEEYLSGSEAPENHTLSQFTGSDSEELEGRGEVIGDEEENTAFIQGYLDARVGNLIVEFKDNLSLDLDDAKDQLRKYVYLLREQEGIKEDFVCFATDGIHFESYEARVPDQAQGRNDVILDNLSEVNLEKVESQDAKRWFKAFISERVNPTVETIDNHFGVGSDLFEQNIVLLEEAYKNSETAEVCYSEWSKYLKYAQGSTVEESDVNPKDLFLRHTYLASFAKILNFLVFSRGSVPSPDEAAEIIKGEVSGPFPDNLFDEDLFSWAGELEEGLEVAQNFIDTLLNFNLGRIDRDIFKQLYQQMVSPGVRHDLGEYYTPDWLAAYVIQELELESEASILDPGAGSGTFLVEAIRYKIDQKERETADFLEDLQEEVVGIDVHPLAVAIAKANYVAAIEDLLSERRGHFSIPIYLADSLALKLRFGDELATTDLGGAEVLEEPVEVWDGKYTYSIPSKGVNSPAEFNQALDIVTNYLNDESGFKWELQREIPEFEGITHAFEDIRSEMSRAKRDRKDSIHAFILRNFSRPLQLMSQDFDAVIGNPPFLTYNRMGSEQQENVKELLNYYNLHPGGGNVVNMDVSTLFVARCLDLYLKDQGKLGFVITRGIFSGKQHEPLRKGEMSAAFDYNLILDLDDVGPLFKEEGEAHVPTAAILGTKGNELDYPVSLRKLTAQLPDRNLELADAEPELESTDGEITLGDGEITSWETDEGTEQSKYHPKFNQGADLTPRLFTSIELNEAATSFGFDPKKPPIKTSEASMIKAKEPYSEIGPLDGEVEKEFIYGILLGSDIVPFAHRDYRPAVVPAAPAGDHYSVLETEDARSGGYSGLASWLETANEHWDSDKKGVETVSSRLNHWDRIKTHDPKAKYRVIYPKGGKNLMAAVAKVDDLDERSKEGTFHLRNMIIDHKIFYYETENETEAYYLSGVLNSDVLNQKIKAFQTTGDFGERDIQKIPLEFPIPEFNPDDERHQQLAELAKECEQKAIEVLPELEEKYEPDVKYMNIRWVREKAKEEVQEEINEANQIVESLL